MWKKKKMLEIPLLSMHFCKYDEPINRLSTCRRNLALLWLILFSFFIIFTKNVIQFIQLMFFNLCGLPCVLILVWIYAFIFFTSSTYSGLFLSVFTHSSLCIGGFPATLSLGYIVILVDYEKWWEEKKSWIIHSTNLFK